jgi:phosphatidylinositol alpha-mannosyltransferase
MKIGIVTPAFHPYPGGVTEHVYHTYRELSSLGHDVRVVTTTFGDGGSPCEDDVIRIGRAISVPANGSICPIALDLKMAGRLRSVFDEQRFDVLHLHEPLMPTLCLSALGQADVPVVGTFHASNDSSLGYRVFRPLLDRYVRRLRRRIAVSSAARQTASRYFPGEYSIVPNGVDVERFELARPLSELDDGGFNILFVGRMEPRKGTKFLLKAMPAILDAVPNARLVVVGGGPLASYYESHMLERCREHIEFTGFVSGDLLARYYASADVFCSPATGGESFGIVLLEAMAAGAAIVASDISGYREVVEGERTGLLVTPGSPDSIANAVIRLARRPDIRERLTARAHEAVKRYAWLRVTQEILSEYESALGIDRSDEAPEPAREREQTRAVRVGEKTHV